MTLRAFISVITYITLHLLASGPMNYLLYLKNTRDFFDIPIALALGTAYKIIIAYFFMRFHKIDDGYILIIVILAFVTRVVFHGPFPIAVLAGWFFLTTRTKDSFSNQ